MINDILTNLRAWTIENMEGYTEDSCSIGDEIIFHYAQTVQDGPRNLVLIEYDGFSDTGRNEYKNTVLQWRVAVNAFFMIEGDDYMSALESARDFVSNYTARVSRTDLYGTVHAVKVLGGEPPMSYERVNFYYILVPITLAVIESVN